MTWGIFLLALLLLICCAVGVHRYRKQAVTQSTSEQEEPIGWRQNDRQLLGFIERLLKGCENQRISGVQIPTYSPFFVVFGVDIVAVPQGEEAGIEELALMEIQVCNALASSFSHHYFWPMNIDGRLICVVNLQASAADPLQTDTLEAVVLPLMRETIDSLRAQNIKIRIVTSGLSVSTESLSIAYQDTIEIFDQLLMRSPDEPVEIIVASPRRIGQHVDHTTRSRLERLFCNYINAQEFDNAELALNKLIEYEEAEQSFSTILKQLVSNRLGWSIDVLSASLTPEQQQQLSKKVAEMSNTIYFDELKQQIADWFVLLRESASPPVKDSFVPKVIDFVSENCYQAELNVAMISEHFHLNASYLSNSFHTQTGVRLIDFIHLQRLKKVKQLLKETDLPISKIAEATGYYSAIAMSRVFKRYEGITPTAYRNS